LFFPAGPDHWELPHPLQQAAHAKVSGLPLTTCQASSQGEGPDRSSLLTHIHACMDWWWWCSELQLRYETFRDKKLLRAGGVLRMVNALCAAMGLYPHDPPMSLAKRVSYRGKEEDPNPTPSRKAPRAKLLPSDTFEDDDEEEECQARLARRKRRRSAPPSTEASSSARPTAELSPQAGRPLPSATRPLPSLDHASLALPLAQVKPRPEERGKHGAYCWQFVLVGSRI